MNNYLINHEYPLTPNLGQPCCLNRDLLFQRPGGGVRVHRSVHHHSAHTLRHAVGQTRHGLCASLLLHRPD